MFMIHRKIGIEDLVISSTSTISKARNKLVCYAESDKSLLEHFSGYTTLDVAEDACTIMCGPRMIQYFIVEV